MESISQTVKRVDADCLGHINAFNKRGDRLAVEDRPPPPEKVVGSCKSRLLTRARAAL
jgi:hypothetical protein